MPKTEMRAKSTNRRPLRDLSNGTKNSKTVKNTKTKKKDDVADTMNTPKDDGAALDRLLFVHSDLSSLLNQIDELVAKALKGTIKIGRQEVESFTQVLSEVQSSLEPWPLRFQKALSIQALVSEKLSEKVPDQSLVSETGVSEDKRDVVQRPEESKFDSLISPSPLVAWHRESTVDGGRQLFLLTPLPRPKTLSSNPRSSFISVFEKLKSENNTAFPPFIGISDSRNDDMLEGIGKEPTPAKGFEFNSNTETLGLGVCSPMTSFKKDGPLLVFTPRLKMSPPKTCLLLEPISELSHKNGFGFRKSTPFPVGIQDLSGSEDSESPSSVPSGNLALKYPELLGIQPSHELGNGRKGIEASPCWLMSPPKSCVLMEPSDGKSLINSMEKGQLSKSTCLWDQQKLMPLAKGDVTSHFTAQEFGGRCIPVESTPMLREPQSNFRAGKGPGENTLKKELWTKFEAASTHEFRFDGSALQQTAKKGFLDLLEEVSLDETKSGI